jgi:hypothetical protein
MNTRRVVTSLFGEQHEEWDAKALEKELFGSKPGQVKDVSDSPSGVYGPPSEAIPTQRPPKDHDKDRQLRLEAVAISKAKPSFKTRTTISGEVKAAELKSSMFDHIFFDHNDLSYCTCDDRHLYNHCPRRRRHPVVKRSPIISECIYIPLTFLRIEKDIGDIKQFLSLLPERDREESFIKDITGWKYADEVAQLIHMNRVKVFYLEELYYDLRYFFHAIRDDILEYEPEGFREIKAMSDVSFEEVEKDNYVRHITWTVYILKLMLDHMDENTKNTLHINKKSLEKFLVNENITKKDLADLYENSNLFQLVESRKFTYVGRSSEDKQWSSVSRYVYYPTSTGIEYLLTILICWRDKVKGLRVGNKQHKLSIWELFFYKFWCVILYFMYSFYMWDNNQSLPQYFKAKALYIEPRKRLYKDYVYDYKSGKGFTRKLLRNSRAGSRETLTNDEWMNGINNITGMIKSDKKNFFSFYIFHGLLCILL